ncbi:MAG: hypothetical protein HGA19_23960, partial [Oscillochloris sp.]|nr:hypothetical protein [Oscillochloris sp.]
GGQGVPLLAWRPILIDLCGIDEGANLNIQRAQLAQALQAVPQIEALAKQALARSLGMAEEPIAEGANFFSDPDESERLIELAVALIKVQLTVGPLLIVLEDIHWSDEISLHLAARLLRSAPSNRPFPLCLTLSHRPLDGAVPEPLTELRATPSATRVTLGRLTSQQSVDLIRALLGVTEVQPELRQHVERQTEGQPLFIKEYLRVLRQHNLAQIDDGVARLSANAAAVQVSNSAQGIIQARVDRLDEPTRLTLKAAAVIGRSFPFRLLATIHPAHPNDHDLLKQLATLINLKIVDLELEAPEPVYRFKYGITHEVAYMSLLFGQRRQLHAAVASWYESAYAADIAAGRAAMAVYDVLIAHLRRAEEWQRQARYCRVAAEQAAQQVSNPTALRYIEQALVATTDLTERYDLLLLRIIINERVGNQVSLAEDIEIIGQLAQQLTDPLRRAYVGYYQICHLLAIGMHQAVLELSETVDQRIRRALRHTTGEGQRQSRLLQAGYLDARGIAEATLGNLVEAQHFHRHALMICLSTSLIHINGTEPAHHWIDSRTLAGRCLTHLGQLAILQSELSNGSTCFREAINLARTTNDWSGEIR